MKEPNSVPDPNRSKGVFRHNTTVNDSEYTVEEFEFFKAIDQYRARYNKSCLSLRETLYVLKCLGYTKPEKGVGNVSTEQTSTEDCQGHF